VVRVTLVGTRPLRREGGGRPRRGALKVLIGKPELAAGADWQAALQLRDAARRTLLAQLGEPDAAA
jgi:hypothetical protein